MTSILANQSIQQARFWDQSLSFISQAVLVEVHRHRCYQVVITLTGTFNCTIEGQELGELKGFIVNQNIPHACRVSEGEVFVSFIEADSYWGGQLRSWLAGKPYLNLEAMLEPRVVHSLLPKGYKQMSNEALIPFINLFFERIFPPVSPSQFNRQQPTSTYQPTGAGSYPGTQYTDNRIRTALDYINQHLHQRLNVEDIADFICLSPVRTRHLFANQTGTPFSQYVLWKRIKCILKATISGQCTLATACIDFGFVDQPHFNRQFKQIFGTQPNALIKGGRVIF